MNRFFVFVLLFTACSSDSNNATPPIRFPDDVGDSQFVEDEKQETSPECDGRFDGESCELPNAAGVCADGNCQIVACESPFLNCDANATTGCEIRGDTNDDCGACGTACIAPALCQLGTTYVCSEDVVCRPNTYDLDGVLDNGCEWGGEWGETLNLAPNGLIDQTATIDAPLLVVGFEGPSTFVAEPAPVPTTLEITNVNAGEPVGVIGTFENWRVAWRQGTSLGDAISPTYEPDQCLGPRTNVAIVGTPETFFLASQNDVTKFDGGIEIARLGLADYLRAFFPFADRGGLTVTTGDPADALDPADVTACGCIFDPTTGEDAVDPGCLGLVECQTTAVDPGVCGACTPSPIDCADFSVRALQIVGDQLFIVTRRGIVVTDLNLQPLNRVENAPTVGVVDGSGFSGGVIENEDVTLFDDGGAVARFSVSDDLPATLQGTGATNPWRQILRIGNAEVAVGDDDAVLIVGDVRRVIDVEPAPTPSAIESAITAFSDDDAFVIWYRYNGGVIPLQLSRD